MGMSTVTVAAVGATAGAVGAISGYFIGARGKESEAAACPEFATGDLYKGKKPKKKKEPAAAGEGNIIDMGVADDGAKLFKAKCATCHSVNEGGPNKQGPNLFGVIGRQSGQVAGFKYTDANKGSGITWTNQTMFDYLQNPKKYIKGTNMAFPGFKKEQDRADVIAYLNTMK